MIGFHESVIKIDFVTSYVNSDDSLQHGFNVESPFRAGSEPNMAVTVCNLAEIYRLPCYFFYPSSFVVQKADNSLIRWTDSDV